MSISSSMEKNPIEPNDNLVDKTNIITLKNMRNSFFKSFTSLETFMTTPSFKFEKKTNKIMIDSSNTTTIEKGRISRWFHSWYKHKIKPLSKSSISSNIKQESSYSFHCKNMNEELRSHINLKRIVTPSISRRISWKPPSQYGLQNSNRIIPEYYFTSHNYNQIFDIDYYNIIIDDIRNIRPLNKYQI